MINRNGTLFYKEEKNRRRRRRNVGQYGFLSFGRNLSNKYGKNLLDTVTKTELDAFKPVIKKVAHKAAQKTEEFIGNKIAVKIVKPKPVNPMNSRNVGKIVTHTREEREEMLNKLTQVL